MWGWNLAASASVQTSGADLGAFGIGAYDGTDEAWVGVTSDDGAGTSQAESQLSQTKTVRHYTPVTPTLDGEADGVFTGNTFRLSYTDLPAVAVESNVLILGDAAGGAPTPRLLGLTGVGT